MELRLYPQPVTKLISSSVGKRENQDFLKDSRLEKPCFYVIFCVGPRKPPIVSATLQSEVHPL